MRYLLPIFLTINFIGHSQSNEYLLNKSFKKNSIELLDEFFSKWEAEIQPIKENEIELLNDTLKNVYSVFQEFINWKNINNSNYKYVLLQNEIKLYFGDKIYYSDEEIDSLILKNIESDDTLNQTMRDKYSKKNNGEYSGLVRELYFPDLNKISNIEFYKTEFNFRPKVNSQNNILYLNKEYSMILDHFLNSEKTGDRKLFLEKYLEIVKQFNSKWEFKPYSNCSLIFDKKMEFAKITYGIGEIIYLKNENGEWNFISHELEFIR